MGKSALHIKINLTSQDYQFSKKSIVYCVHKNWDKNLMKRINQTALLFLIVLTEGYIVLSTELLAMRQTTPFVGTGTDIISIIIAAVLMPLAFGYHYGGRFKQGKHFGFYFSIRKKLIFNLVVAAIILLPGMSYLSLTFFFDGLRAIGIGNRLNQTFIFCGLFLVIPVYLLGQTIPLISNYFSKEKLSRVTGRMLCFSTLGSFLGAVFSTLVLMSTIGVHHTASLNFILIASLVILLSKRKLSDIVVLAYLIAAISMVLNSNYVMRQFRIVKNNNYSTTKAFMGADGYRHLIQDNNMSSRYNDLHQKHLYIEFAERIALHDIQNMEGEPRDILVVGAGAFTFGHEDYYNNYTYVDIDKDLKDIAEQYILREPIGANKKFVPEEIRGFLNGTKQQYDVIFLDAYLGGMSIPEQLVTTEFFQQVKAHLKPNALLLTNFIVCPNFCNAFTKNIDDTLRSVFPYVSRQVISEQYNMWNTNTKALANVAYIYRNDGQELEQKVIYTDDKNTVFWDKPK